MNKNILRTIIYTLLAIIIGVVSIKFIIWISPVIILGILGYCIYSLFKKNEKKPIKKKTYKKPIKIIDMVEDDK